MWLLPAFVPVSRLATASFYRLQIIGPEIPRRGPVLLLANHPNSLLDPALVVTAAGRPVRFLAKSTLFTDPRVGWLVRAAGAIPVFRRSDEVAAAHYNVDMFEAVSMELAKGAAVGIFPEGISHSEPRLAPLKTGSARIALGTSARSGSTFPLIPCGLVLRDKGVFRSEALVIRGEPVPWGDLQSRGVDDREAVQELTDRLTQALLEVTLNLEHWQDRPLVECAEAVWSSELGRQSRSRLDSVQRAQTAAAVLADLRRRGDPSWVDLARQIERHRRRLQFLGLTPDDLHARLDLATGARWTLRRLPLLGPPLLLLALCGSLVFWPSYRLTDRLVAAARPSEDQQSTWKTLLGGMVHGLWVVLLTALAGWLWGGWPALAVLIVLPLSGLSSLWVRERWQGARNDARKYLLLRSRGQLRARLQAEQKALADSLQQAWANWQADRNAGV